MKTSRILVIFLGIMGGMILFAAFFPRQMEELLFQPALYPHVLFTHVVSTTLFFANALVGILWEAKSLGTGRKEIIYHTYATVAWLDARLSSAMIILSLGSGIMLGVILGGIWSIGWLSVAFLLFLFSGIIWVVSDIPSQYRINALKKTEDPTNSGISIELLALLKMRLGISIAGIMPLFVVFWLMIYKPYIIPASEWFR